MFKRSSIVASSRRLLQMAAALFLLCSARAEIIYDNTSTYLSNYVSEPREYGDQLDLGGMARRLTQVEFYYYGRFATNGDEAVKVRFYSNERNYDSFRKSPTTLLYESEWMPIQSGFKRHILNNLNLVLPAHTATFTVEFKGIGAGEEAGLLFYGPPTEGYSFNEFWMHNPDGKWAIVNYSNNDPFKRASVGLRLIATPDVVVDQQQPSAARQVAMRRGGNSVRYGQTFTADVTGYLAELTVNTAFTNEAPIQVRILDTIDGKPGPHVLGRRNILSGGGTNQTLNFLASAVHLQKGRQYAIEFSTTAPLSAEATYLIAAATNSYARGELWYRNEGPGVWTAVSDPRFGLEAIDAAFQVRMVPMQPSVDFISPRPSQSFDFGEPIVLRSQTRPPEIGTILRVRYFAGTNEIGSATKPPYEFVWTTASAGEHQLRAVAEDSFRRPFRTGISSAFVRQPGPPENDSFANRLPLEGLNPRRMKPTAAATLESGEALRATSVADATVWWSWTAYDSTSVRISAQNSSRPGAMVSIFTGTNVTALLLVTNGAPSVQFAPVAGVTYAISVSPEVRGDLVVLDMLTADVRLSAPLPTSAKANQPLVFSTTGPRAGNITNVSLWLGGIRLASSDSAPARLTNAIPFSGHFDLSLVATDERGLKTVFEAGAITVRPQNDSFAERLQLLGESPSIQIRPGGGTLETGEPSVVGLSYTERSSTWWSWTAPASGVVRVQVVSTQSPASLAIFSGSTLSQLTLVAQTISPQILTLNAVAGQTYQIRVVGNAQDTQPLRLSITGDWLRLNIGKGINGTMNLSFNLETLPPGNLLVEYSSDLRTWKRAATGFVPAGGAFAWLDAGLPATEKPPGGEGARFYRVVRE
ncbi:MAG TPA: Ig-like domain-containing protein [Verrucomicrobiae bacterium]